MDKINLTFSAKNDAELIVAIDSLNNVSFRVFEGKTALFDKEDTKKIFDTIKHIIEN